MSFAAQRRSQEQLTGGGAGVAAGRLMPDGNCSQAEQGGPRPAAHMGEEAMKSFTLRAVLTGAVVLATLLFVSGLGDLPGDHLDGDAFTPHWSPDGTRIARNGCADQGGPAPARLTSPRGGHLERQSPGLPRNNRAVCGTAHA
jgi:hypothetical protein